MVDSKQDYFTTEVKKFPVGEPDSGNGLVKELNLVVAEGGEKATVTIVTFEADMFEIEWTAN